MGVPPPPGGLYKEMTRSPLLKIVNQCLSYSPESRAHLFLANRKLPTHLIKTLSLYYHVIFWFCWSWSVFVCLFFVYLTCAFICLGGRDEMINYGLMKGPRGAPLLCWPPISPFWSFRNWATPLAAREVNWHVPLRFVSYTCIPVVNSGESIGVTGSLSREIKYLVF